MENSNQQIPQPQPLPPLQQVSPHSNFFNRNKKLIIIVLLILVVMYITIHTYVYFAVQNIHKTLSSFESFPTPQPSQVIDSTANWKTYINTKNRYSLKYPNDWLFAESNDIIEIYPEYNENIQVDRVDLYPPGNFPARGESDGIPELKFDIIIEVIDNSQNLTIEQYIKRYLNNTVAIIYTKLVEVEASRTSNVFKNGAKQENVIFIKENKIYRIILLQNGGKEISMDTFDQILSTFRFTDKISNNFPAEEEKNFPVYPKATLISRLEKPSCNTFPEEGTTVFDCGSIVYGWQSFDEFSKVVLWYIQTQHNTGWICSYSFANNDIDTIKRTGIGYIKCNKNDLTALIVISSESNHTNIIAALRYKKSN